MCFYICVLIEPGFRCESWIHPKTWFVLTYFNSEVLLDKVSMSLGAVIFLGIKKVAEGTAAKTFLKAKELKKKQKEAF